MGVSSGMSYANSCGAIPQGLPSMWCVRWLALILSDHTDRGSAVQSLDAVFPDWSRMCIHWPHAVNALHHGSGYGPYILCVNCPWTFRKPHSLLAFDMASSLLWYFRLLLKSALHIFYRDREADISVLYPMVSLPVAAAPSIHQLGILSLQYVLSAAFSIPSLQIHTIAGIASRLLP